jgi:transcriptional regulator with XRE-family HTH domain
LSQEELADRARLDRTYVSGVERGIRNPTVLVLQDLAGALGVRAMDLLDFADSVVSS